MRDSRRPATSFDDAPPSGEPMVSAPAGQLPNETGPEHLQTSTGEPTVSRRTVVSVGAAAALFIYLFAIIGTGELAPAHAIVLDDVSARTFTTPACATSRPPNAPVLVRTTLGAAKARGHVPEQECWRAGGFLGSGSSRLKQLLVTLGLDRGSDESRWRADGSWRW